MRQQTHSIVSLLTSYAPKEHSILLIHDESQWFRGLADYVFERYSHLNYEKKCYLIIVKDSKTLSDTLVARSGSSWYPWYRHLLP